MPTPGTGRLLGALSPLAWGSSPELQGGGLGLWDFGALLAAFLGGSDGKASAYNVGDPGSIPELGRSPGEGNGNLLRYYCLENPVDRGAW